MQITIQLCSFFLNPYLFGAFFLSVHIFAMHRDTPFKIEMKEFREKWALGTNITFMNLVGWIHKHELMVIMSTLWMKDP